MQKRDENKYYKQLKKLESYNMQDLFIDNVSLTDATEITAKFIFKAKVLSKDEFVKKCKGAKSINAIDTSESPALVTLICTPMLNDDNASELTEYTAGFSESVDDISSSHTVDSAEVLRYLEGSKDIDEFFVDTGVLNAVYMSAFDILGKNTNIDMNLMDEKINDETYLENSVNLGPIKTQDGSVYEAEVVSGINALRSAMRKEVKDGDIPDNFKRKEPSNIIMKAVETVVNDALCNIYMGAPATFILGPTGSGKSMVAGKIEHQLSQVDKTHGIMTIDVSERANVETLFYRDDFTKGGTHILEGTIPTAARRMRKLGKKLLITLEEFNTAKDELRREFYRILNNDEYRYLSLPFKKELKDKDGKVIRAVNEEIVIPADHIQFLILGNPASNENYLTDDMNFLSNAESRRMLKFIYQDYETDPRTVAKILKAINQSFPAYKRLKKSDPTILEDIDYNKGVTLHSYLNTKKRELNINYDFGYVPIAHMLFTTAIQGNTDKALKRNVLYNLVYPLVDIRDRNSVAAILDAQLGIQLTEDEINKGMT